MHLLNSQHPIAHERLVSDRWNVLCPTEPALRTERRELLDGPVICCENAIRYGGIPGHAKIDVFATLANLRRAMVRVAGLQVWAPEATRYVWAKAGVPFEPICGYGPLTPGPRGIPRPSPALFLAIEKIAAEHGCRHVRVFGAHWTRKRTRWQGWSLRGMKKAAELAGVDIEIVPPKL